MTNSEEKTMYRSASANRFFSGDNYYNHKPTSPTSSSSSSALRALSLEAHELPQYEPLSEVAKKEKARAKLSQNAVHLIPLVIILCALTLWLLSNPEMEFSMGGDMGVAGIEGMTLEGDNDINGTQKGHLEMADFETAKLEEIEENRKAAAKLGKFSRGLEFIPLA